MSTTIAEIVEYPDEELVTGLTATIKGVGRLISSKPGSPNEWTLLPMTLEDPSGEIRVSLFNPTVTDWKQLKGKRCKVSSNKKGNATMGTYNGERQITLSNPNAILIEGLGSNGDGPQTATQSSGRSTAPAGGITDTELIGHQKRWLDQYKKMITNEIIHEGEWKFMTSMVATLSIALMDGRLKVDQKPVKEEDPMEFPPPPENDMFGDDDEDFGF